MSALVLGTEPPLPCDPNRKHHVDEIPNLVEDTTGNCVEVSCEVTLSRAIISHIKVVRLVPTFSAWHILY